MASADLALSWKEHFRDSSHFSDHRNSQRGSVLADSMQKQSKEPLLIDNCHNPHWVMQGLRTKCVQDEELCVLKAPCEHEPGIWEFLDRPVLFNLIKSISKQKDLLQGSTLHANILRRGLLKNDITLGNALLSMYAKCGALPKAREVFDQLYARNVITWNALIAAYVQYGLGNEALSCFQQMQEEGFSPNAATFVSSLKACGILRAVEKGQEMHAEISRQGLLKNDSVLSTALVDMYVKCGALAKAQGVFDKLRAWNVITWNVLLAGYVQHACADEAFSCFDRMQDEGLRPDAVTFLYMLKVCTSIRAIDKGEEIHEEINKQGFLEKHNALCNALVDMYAKCGKLAKAKEGFDKLAIRTVVSWNSLIDGYVQNGQYYEAESCFELMQNQGIFPDAVTFLCILKACGSIGAAEKGEHIHKEVERQQLLEKNTALGNALVDMYAKCGLLAKAQAVFDKLPARDVVSWNTLIDGYAQHGLLGDALRCFLEMRNEGLSSDASTFVSILKCCGSKGALEKGEEMHAEIDKRGLLGKDIVLGNALVDMYAKCGALEKAQSVFDKLLARDAITWNVLISGYVEHGLNERALGCFKQMQGTDFSPNTVTLLCILKACSSLGLKKGEEIHAEIDRQGLVKKSIAIGNALVDMYAKCGEIMKAQEVFEKLPLRNVVTWNTLLAGYAQHRCSDQAMLYFERMQAESFVPDSVSFLCILKACGNLGAAQKGEEIYTMVNQQGLLEKDIMLGTALVDMYAKCGALAKSCAVFDKLTARDIVLWNALISGYAQVGKVNMVLSCFQRMIAEGMDPDEITFIILLTACSHAGLVKEGQVSFCTMRTTYGIIPTLEHCTCMVDIFSRAGHFDKAISMIERVPSSDRLVLWSAFMSACQTWVLVELGRWAFEHVIQLGESSVAAYVCMRNMYTVEEADEIEALRKETWSVDNTRSILVN